METRGQVCRSFLSPASKRGLHKADADLCPDLKLLWNYSPGRWEEKFTNPWPESEPSHLLFWRIDSLHLQNKHIASAHTKIKDLFFGQEATKEELTKKKNVGWDKRIYRESNEKMIKIQFHTKKFNSG